MLEGPLVLIVRDGWGVRAQREGNGVAAAATPRLDDLLAAYPHCLLDASEHFVGLPAGQMGNSEVGHLNIGAGRVVYQDLTRIEWDLSDGRFYENPALTAAVDRARERNRGLHLIGLLSPGGVHSHERHLYALLDLAKRRGLSERVFIHAITDGRDTPRRSGLEALERLVARTRALGVGRIASVTGRYFSMDRNANHERVKRGYDALFHGLGESFEDPLEGLRASYAREVTDEFVEPFVIVDAAGEAIGRLRRGDQALFWNFRGDRARQLSAALAREDFEDFDRGAGFAVELTAFCEYKKDLPFSGIAFPPRVVDRHLVAWLSELGKASYKLAETEKYAHVTFFFNGGIEAPCPREGRFLVPSPAVKTYDLKPEMSAYEVTAAAVDRIGAARDALIVINYANTDMLGHTGDFDAVVRAVEVVDECVGRVVDAARAKGGAAFITADHGNAEQMLDPVTGRVHTAHTLCPVHGLLVSDAHRGRRLRAGVLADVAPTLLDVMGVPRPAEMTAEGLLLEP